MESILTSITEWLQKLLIDAIMFNVEGMFDILNPMVQRAGTEIGKTPAQWNGSIYTMVENLSNTVIMPIAGVILALVMCYELIHMIVEKNNMNDFPPSDIFKWIIKTMVAATIVTNTFPIVMGIFELAQTPINQAASMISSSTNLSAGASSAFASALQGESIGGLILIYWQTAFLVIAMQIMTVMIFVILYIRMIEIYLVISLAPLPMATMGNRELSGVGQNYLKSIFALAFQGFLLMICIGIYAVLIQNFVTSSDVIAALWQAVGYVILLLFSLLKTSSLSKRIFSTH